MDATAPFVSVTEAHNYLRVTMQMWVHWFSFFVTVNYIAMGWAVSGWAGTFPKSWVVYGVLVFQWVLAAAVCVYLKRWMNNVTRYLDRGGTSTYGVHEFYRLCINFGMAAIASIAIGLR